MESIGGLIGPSDDGPYYDRERQSRPRDVYAVSNERPVPPLMFSAIYEGELFTLRTGDRVTLELDSRSGRFRLRPA